MKQVINGFDKRIYLDTDVLISSQLSFTGAANWLIYQTINLSFNISNLTQDEFNQVINRLKIKADKNIFQNFDYLKDPHNTNELKKKYSNFVNDPWDCHILSGAINSASEYIITYNISDYKIDLIRNIFNIIIIRPGEFLQYLRSQNL